MCPLRVGPSTMVQASWSREHAFPLTQLGGFPPQLHIWQVAAFLDWKLSAVQKVRPRSCAMPAVLCWAVLCMLHYAALCCAMLRYAMLCSALLCDAMLCDARWREPSHCSRHSAHPRARRGVRSIA